MTKDELLRELDNLSPSDLREVAKAIIDKLGAFSMIMPGVAYGISMDEESGLYDVILEAIEPKLIIRTIRSVRNLSLILDREIGLKEAKEIFEDARHSPVLLAEAVERDVADRIVAEFHGSTGLTETEATVTIRPH